MDKIIKYLPERLRFPVFSSCKKTGKSLREIRMKVGAPLAIILDGGTYYINEKGDIVSSPASGLRIFKEDAEDSFERLCRSSVYSYTSEISNGFITVEGGNRVGLVGSAVCKNGEVVGMKNISGLIFRLAREVIGCGENHYSMIKSAYPSNTLLVSPPGCGKTTVLRDLSRLFSNDGKRVCIVDCRHEIAAVRDGISGFDVGLFTDILDGYPKLCGIEQAVRTLSPEIIIFDELGSSEEAEKLVAGGCMYIGSVHGGSLEEAKRRDDVKLLYEKSGLSLLILMSDRLHPGKITGYERL